MEAAKQRRPASRSTGLAVRGVAYAVLGLVAIVLPWVLSAVRPAFVGTTYGAETLHLELLGFTGSAALLGVGAIEMRRRGRDLRELIPLLLFLLVGFHTLLLVSEYTEKLFDYQCYEGAAKAIISGGNPYANRDWWYQYPPLTAQVLAWSHQGLAAGSALLGVRAKASTLWDLIFYVYQCLQAVLVLMGWLLCHRFGRSLGLPAILAAVLVTALYLVNNPLVRTLRWSQLNLWILDLVLLGILLRARAPSVAGLAVALGGHLKLYPLVLLGPWLATKQWRVSLACFGGLAGILLLQTGGGRHWELWRQFIAFAPSFAKGALFRDNSIHSIVYNFARLQEPLTSLYLSPAGLEVISLILSAAVLAVFAWRFFARERAWRTFDLAPEQREQAGVWRHASHAMDALALTLMVAPSVWEHHYVLAIPIMIWAVAGWGSRYPIALASAAILIFALPTFDVFPLSYHRIAGLVMLLWVTRKQPEPLGPRSREVAL